MSFDILKVLDAKEQKALDSTTSGEGDEFVPDDLAAELMEQVRLQNKVYGLFPEVEMPTNPYKFPVEGADATAYVVAESTGEDGTGQNKAAASNPGSANMTLTAKKIMARTYFSTEVQEDSIVPIADYVKGKISRAISDGLEKAVLDGDTAASQDSDSSAGDALTAWNGLRKLALAVSGLKVDLGTFNVANVRSLRKAMGKYGVNPADLAWIVGPSVYNQLMGLDVVQTLDKYGPNATILTGELGKFDGIPLIVSEHVREDLNASGVYDGVTTTKTYMLLAHRQAFVAGNRSGMTIKTDEDIENDQIKAVSRVRKAYSPIWTPSATYKTVAIGYNITS